MTLHPDDKRQHKVQDTNIFRYMYKSNSHTKHVQILKYSKTCVKCLLKNRQIKILMTNGSLMKVKSIAECSPWSILQYFLPALSDNWSLKPIFGLFESGCFTQVLGNRFEIVVKTSF